ncbi:MAG: hypothetical protein U0M12_09075 [Acutalibacteraceae bacterium]|nr:hypothetical protein [Acutalibacteraceae bacterium]
MNNPLDISKMYGLDNKNNTYNKQTETILNQPVNTYALQNEFSNVLPISEPVYNPRKINTTSSTTPSSTKCPFIENKIKANTQISSIPYSTKNTSYANSYATNNNTNVQLQNITHKKTQDTSKSHTLVPSVVTDSVSAMHPDTVTVNSVEGINTPHIVDNIHTQNLPCMTSFLRTQTGKKARVEFKDDYNITIKYGCLVGVGENYIVLQEFNSDTLLVCDNSDIKFITLCNP